MEFHNGNRVAPLLTQIRTAYITMDCGMCYVMRLLDGSFVVYDANTGENEEIDRIFDVLKEQNVNEKIVISAWIFSHAHCDHIGGFADFVTKYKNEIVLEKVIYCWPKDESVYPLSQYGQDVLTKFENKISEIKGETQIITPKADDQFNLGGVDFKVLFTGEDLYPEFIPNFNDSSLVFTAQFENYKILFLGDAQKQASDFICQKYDESEIKCDILQVGHHGYGGGSDALYKAADPDALLWPCPDFWFPVIKYWEPNEFLLTSSKIKHTYLSGRQQITLDLSKPLPQFMPYKTCEKGETVLDLDFNSNRVIDLNFNCITGGATGYKGAKAVLEKGELTLETQDGENYCVCQFVQPGLLELNPSFSVEISGKLSDGYGQFGLVYDYEKPTVFCDEKVLWLTPDVQEQFNYTLVCNGETNKAELLMNEEKVLDLPYETVGGIHVVLKNAKLSLNKFKVIRN